MVQIRQIVNPFHAGYAGHGLSDFFGVQMSWDTFHEHMHGLSEQCPRAPDDKDTDARAQERIDEKPPREPDRDSAKDDSD